MGWRSPPMLPVLPVPSSSCGQGWAAAWSERGCRAPRCRHWVSGLSCPGSPGNPGAPGSTDQLHPPPQIPVSLLEQRQLRRFMKKVNTCLNVFYLFQWIGMQSSAHIHKYDTILFLVFTLPDADVSGVPFMWTHPMCFSSYHIFMVLCGSLLIQADAT